MNLYTCTPSRYVNGRVHIVALIDGPVTPLCRVGLGINAEYRTTGKTATCSGCLTAWREGKR